MGLRSRLARAEEDILALKKQIYEQIRTEEGYWPYYDGRQSPTLKAQVDAIVRHLGIDIAVQPGLTVDAQVIVIPPVKVKKTKAKKSKTTVKKGKK